ncbi:MAG TPA: cobalt ECF transporter T component CbiQ [Acidimicrobiales bacterium]
MGAGHVADLVVPGPSPVHRLPAQCKLAATFLFVVAVVATPREAFWAFAAHAAVVVAAAAVGRLPLGVLARRLVIEVPFLLFALALPLVGGGERTEVLGVPLSVAGLWGAWSILAKATLGLGATLVLTATTPLADVVTGLDRLRVPRVFTAVAGAMVRYADVVAGDLRRMRIARESRGSDPRWLWQARAVAATAGALFVRSYERGERVHLAMLSRGFDGTMPAVGGAAAAGADWLAALLVPAAAAAVALAAAVAA